MHYIDDALGMCAGLSSFPLKPPYHIHNYPKFISAATGIDMDEAGLTQVYQEEPDSGQGHQCKKRLEESRREAAGGPLEEKISRARRRSSWMRITNSRGGITRVFPPKRPCTNWAWITLAEDFGTERDLFRNEMSARV